MLGDDATPSRPPEGGASEDFGTFFQFPGAATPLVEVGQQSQPADVTAPPRLGLLSTLSNEEFDIVARSARLTMHEAGAMLIAVGDVADRFYILVEGQVELQRDGVVLDTLGPGAFFGELALLAGGRRTASARAVTGVSLWSVGYDAFTAAISVHLLANADVRAVIEARLRAQRGGTGPA